MAAGRWWVLFIVLLVTFCGSMPQCEKCLKNFRFSEHLTLHLKKGGCETVRGQEMQDLEGPGDDGGRDSDDDGAGEGVDAWGSPAEWDPNDPRERWHMGIGSYQS